MAIVRGWLASKLTKRKILRSEELFMYKQSKVSMFSEMNLSRKVYLHLIQTKQDMSY